MAGFKYQAIANDGRIHQGVLKTVSHVEATRNIGGREHDAIRILRLAL